MTDTPENSATARPSLALRFCNLDPEGADAEQLAQVVDGELKPIGVDVSRRQMVARSADLPTWIEIAVAGLAAERLWHLTAEARRRVGAAVREFVEKHDKPTFKGVVVKIYVDRDEHQVIVAQPPTEDDLDNVLSALPSFTNHVRAWKEVLGLDRTQAMTWTVRDREWLPLRVRPSDQHEVDDCELHWDKLDQVRKMLSKNGPMPDPTNADSPAGDHGYDYDVALSFAGEDRPYVAEVAKELGKRGFRFFYDELEEAKLWGTNLYEHLAEIYSKRARYCILFISEHSVGKAWPRHERRAVQERALEEPDDYLLPARFDDTEVPGLPKTVFYADLRKKSPEQLVALFEGRFSGSTSPTGPVAKEGPLTDEALPEWPVRGGRLCYLSNPEMSDKEVVWEDRPFAFLRLEPLGSAQTWTALALYKMMGSHSGPWPFGPELSASYERNKAGAVKFLVTSDELQEPVVEVGSFVQVYTNGALFGVNGYLPSSRRVIPTIGLERSFEEFLYKSLRFVESDLQIECPLRLVAGLKSVEDFKLGLPERFSEDLAGRSLQDCIAYQTQVSSFSDAPADLLRPFYEHVWEVCGSERPSDFQDKK